MEYLLLALGLSIAGVVVVLVRHRRPSGLRSGIDDFERRRAALAPPPDGLAEPLPEPEPQAKPGG